MKNEILLALVLLACAPALAAQTNQAYTIKLIPSPQAYTGPTNVTVEVGTYYFLVSTNVTLPLSQWTSFGATPASFSVPGNPNYVAVTSFSSSVAMNPPVYFAGSISNSTGVSPFSNLAGYLGPMQGGRFTGVTSP